MSEVYIKLGKKKWEELLRRIDEFKDTRWLSREDEQLKKSMQTIVQYLDVLEEKKNIVLHLNKIKFFHNEVKTLEDLKEKLKKVISACFSQFLPTEIVYTEKDIEVFHASVMELWKASYKIQFDAGLSFYTNNPLLAGYAHRLQAWEATYDKDVEGRVVYKLERPMFWERDVETLKEEGFKFVLHSEQILTLNALKTDESDEYLQVKIVPHANGIAVLLYKYIEEAYRKRLETHCKVKYYINYNRQDPELSNWEWLYFIERDYELDQEEDRKIGYRAFYFTLPTIKQFFENQGFNVKVDPILIRKLPKLPFKLEPTFELYKYPQEEAFDNWLANDEIGTMEMPTGTGKSHVGMQAIVELKTKTLIIVPTINLKNQWVEMIHKWLGVPREFIGEFYGGKKEIKSITVATVQSASKYAKKKKKKDNNNNNDREATKDELELAKEIGMMTDKFGQIITDEGHHMAAPIWKEIMLHMKCFKRMSLTATPRREDRNEPLIFFAMGDVIFSTTYYESAIKSEPKLVCPIKYEKIPVKLSSYETDILEHLAQIKAKRVGLKGGWGYGRRKKKEELKELREEFYELWSEHPYILEGGSRNLSPMRVVHCYAENKFHELLKILKRHYRDRVLIFNEYVKGTRLISDFLKENGFERHLIMTGSTREIDRKDILHMFETIPTAKILTTTVLDEGIDVPMCNVVVIFNGTRTPRQMIQRIGRGCRYQPCKVEYAYELVTKEYVFEESKKEIWNITVEEKEYEKERKRLFNYEQKASKYRDPSKVIEPEKQEEIIGKVLALKRCKVLGCFNETTEKSKRYEICEEHLEMLREIAKAKRVLSFDEKVLMIHIKDVRKRPKELNTVEDNK